MILPAANTALKSTLRATRRPSMVPLPPEPDAIARLELYTLASAALPDPPSRTLSVYLPEAYASEPARRFPVFYLHDGQNLFDPRTSYIPGHTWQANEAADRLAAAGEIEPVILVGIANTGLRRMPEYTPTRDPKLAGGDGPRYGKLLLDEVKPFLDRTYRTLTAPAGTGLGGSSLGGLISLYLGLERPAVFGQLAVLSPSLWWNNRVILPMVQKLAAQIPVKPRIWLDIGTAEGLRHVRDTELLGRLLLQSGWQDQRTLRLDIVPGAAHNEDAWAARFPDVLRFLFPATP